MQNSPQSSNPIRQSFVFQRSKDGGASLTLRIAEACFTLKMSPQQVETLKKKIENWHRRMHGQEVMSGQIKPQLYKIVIAILKDKIENDYCQIAPATRRLMCITLRKIATSKAKSDAKKRGGPVERKDIINAEVYAQQLLEKAGVPVSNPRDPFWMEPTATIAEKLSAIVKNILEPSAPPIVLSLPDSGSTFFPPTYTEGPLTRNEVSRAATIMGAASKGSPAAQLAIMRAIKAANAGSPKAKRDILAMTTAKNLARKRRAQDLRKARATATLGKPTWVR